MAIVAKYKENKERPQGQRPADYFAQAWAYLQKETLGSEQDILGELFMQHITHGEHGQFFTPVPIADLMARIAGDGAGETVSDPTCGSGRMFISMSKLNKNIRCNGVDLSPTCAKMTALNMWLFDINADIYHGDSLTMKMYRVWRVRKGGYIYSEEVKELPESVKVQMQQTLFDTQEFKKKAA